METLAKNPRGFFLMVEGSEIDWADHANDPVQLVSDMLAYGRAVAAALVKEFWGMEITAEEAAQILAEDSKWKEDPSYGIGQVLSPRYTVLGWTAHGHTGGDVPFFAYGPGRPAGLLDGPEVGRATAQALGLDLGRLTSRLFVEAGSAFPGGVITLDRADAKNPMVRIDYKGRRAEFPVNKNTGAISGKPVTLEGVVVFAPETGKVYLPMRAMKLVFGSPVALPRVTR